MNVVGIELNFKCMCAGQLSFSLECNAKTATKYVNVSTMGSLTTEFLFNACFVFKWLGQSVKEGREVYS